MNAVAHKKTAKSDYLCYDEFTECEGIKKGESYYSALNGVKKICLKCWQVRQDENLRGFYAFEEVAEVVKHQLTYSTYSTKVSWCDICKKHFYNERNEKHTLIATTEHYHLSESRK